MIVRLFGTSAEVDLFTVQVVPEQHGNIAVKMVCGWKFGVNVQGTSLRAVASNVHFSKQSLCLWYTIIRTVNRPTVE